MGDKMREEFEAWYSEHYRVETGRHISPEYVKSMREGGLYGERGYLNGCWIGWQASRAAAEIGRAMQ